MRVRRAAAGALSGLVVAAVASSSAAALESNAPAETNPPHAIVVPAVSQPERDRAPGAASADLTDAPNAAVQETAAEPAHPAVEFFGDVGRDYRQFFSKESAAWLSGGVGAALGAHVADDWFNSEQPQTFVASNMQGGAEYGLVTFQMPLAIAWWTVGHLASSPRDAQAGRDLLRAQISAASWTYALKFAAQRTRPNGDPRSFPSGHASATFATATVLQDHYGWKVSLPAYVLASYTAVSRIADNKHWFSDVVFGAFLGVTSARAVTVRLRRTQLSMSATPTDGGAAIMLTAVGVRP